MPKFVVKEIDKKRSIGQVAKELDIQTHVIRFWETKFTQIKPVIGRGDRRYYFEKDINLLKKIKYFLYEEGYTIAGLQKLFVNRGKRKVPASDNSRDSNDLGKEEIKELINNIEENLLKFQNLIR